MEQDHSSPISESKRLPVVSDPKQYVDGFRESEFYKGSFSAYLNSKADVAQSIPEDRLRNIFEESQAAREAFLDYSRKDTRFEYNPENYPPEVAESIKGYIDSVKELFKAKHDKDQDLIINADSLRSARHDLVADKLVKAGILTSRTLGRSLARLVLINKGLDTYSTAYESEIDRAKRSR